MSNLNKNDINYIINILKSNNEDELLKLKNTHIYINIMKQLKDYYYN